VVSEVALLFEARERRSRKGNLSGSVSDDRAATAVRIMGKPACGDNPREAFSSCAELQAFRD
jgi:hypothetical protein